MKPVEINDLDVMWKGYHEAMDAAAMILAKHPTIAADVFAELESRIEAAHATRDRHKMDFTGYGRAMFMLAYNNHLTPSI